MCLILEIQEGDDEDAEDGLGEEEDEEDDLSAFRKKVWLFYLDLSMKLLHVKMMLTNSKPIFFPPINADSEV